MQFKTKAFQSMHLTWLNWNYQSFTLKEVNTNCDIKPKPEKWFYMQVDKYEPNYNIIWINVKKTNLKRYKAATVIRQEK